MNHYAEGFSAHPDPRTAVAEAVGQIADRISRRDLVLLAIGAGFRDHAPAIERAVRELLAAHHCIAFVSSAVISGGTEAEHAPGVALFACTLENAIATPFQLDTAETPDGPSVTGMLDQFATANAALLLADPFTAPAEAMLERITLEYPHMQLFGGLPAFSSRPQPAWLSINGEVHERGAIGIAFEGLDLSVVVSQGCRPIGDPFVITEAEDNFICELGGRPALERLMELVESVSSEERALLTEGLHVGLVVDEHQSEFERGDFLVRAVLGAEKERGAIAIGDRAVLGTTAQFHVRDAESADEDLRLALTNSDVSSAALLFTCNGRGQSLFRTPDHDAGMIQELLGPVPLFGSFCAGEIGPVAGIPYLHGFTAVVAEFHS